jgi:hypothetical protein
MIRRPPRRTAEQCGSGRQDQIKRSKDGAQDSGHPFPPPGDGQHRQNDPGGNAVDLSSEVVGRYLADDSSLTATERRFRLFAGIASLEAVSRLMCTGDLDGALRKGQTILEGAAEEPAVRLQAGVMFAHVYATVHETKPRKGEFSQILATSG